MKESRKGAAENSLGLIKAGCLANGSQPRRFLFVCLFVLVATEISEDDRASVRSGCEIYSKRCIPTDYGYAQTTVPVYVDLFNASQQRNVCRRFECLNV